MADISAIKLPNGDIFDLVDEKSGYITAETDPLFSASAAAGITSTDISNWNNKISDDHKWNDVSLTKSATSITSDVYVPCMLSTSATSAELLSVLDGATTAYSLVRRNGSGYIKAATPPANDNSTKVATTAYIQALLADNITINKGKYLIFDYGNDNPRSVSFSINGSSSSGGNVTNFIGSFDTPVRLGGISTPLNNTDAANKKYVDDSIGALSIPTKTSDLTNDSGFITSASLPDLSNYIQNHYSDSVNSYILPWTYEGAGYIVYRALYSNNESSSASITYGVDTQRNSYISLGADSLHFIGNIELQSENDYNHSIYLTIPTLSSDVTLTLPNTTGTLALTSNIPTKTSDLTNDSGFVTTDEKVKTINTGDNINYYLVMGSRTGTETKMTSKGLYYKENSSDHISTLTIGYPMTSGHLTGNIVLAKDNNYNTTIVPSTNGTHNTLTLPNSTGTLALTSDIPPTPLIPTDLSDLNNDLNVSDFPNDAGYITGYTETDPVFTASAAYGISASDITNWNGKSNFSGNYNDLTNKPTIPVVPTNISAFTNDSGYITSYTETDPIFSNSAASGILSSDITNWNSKQAALVSGTNIKTINSQSLLGSGDITTQTIYASTVAPTSADGIDGDVWFIYIPSA